MMRRLVLLSIMLLSVAFAGAHEPQQNAPATQPTTRNAELKPVDVKYMLRGYFIAGTSIKDDKAPGGFGSSDNTPKSIHPDLITQRDKLYFDIDATKTVPFGEHEGIVVRLINGKNEVQALDASDSRLSIVAEAKDADGKWKPIEYLPSSWCGNSYHRVLIRPNEYWHFNVPRYSGSIKTMLRYRLAPSHNAPAIYSPEFQGSINPEQFTLKQGHKPADIMDPYND